MQRRGGNVLKRAIQKGLRRVGYQLIMLPDPGGGAFAAQGELVKVKEPVIFDIGAHTGAVTATYRKLFPRAWIHSFEPFPRSFADLAGKARGDPRISCHDVAVCGHDGIATLNANFSSSTNSLLPTDARASLLWGDRLLETVSQIEVKTTTVDAFCRDAAIPHIHILKMDVQGAEYSVLEGAGTMLADQSISLIYTELITGPTYEGQRKLHDYLSLLDSFGYSLLDFFSPVRRGRRLMQLDAVFVSPALMSEAGLA